MAEIRFEKVSKKFGTKTIIKDLDLTIEDGSFTVMIGPSGCGKTTLLRMIAGIGPQTSGKIYLDGKDISDIPPAKRNVAMVFQNYAIYPTMTVRENIEFGLKNNKVPKEERDRLVREVTESVGIDDLLERKPNTLSGGQRQRIALARAMIKKPKVFLMDEPLSNLDAKLRSGMRTELIELHKRLKTTFVYVTHDQIEAMSMASHIILMNDGEIIQSDSPRDIYNNPKNLFTAQFIGSPQMNVLKAAGNEISFCFRPEKVHMSIEASNLFYCRKGEIVTKEMLGSETLYQIRFEGQSVMVKSLDDNFQEGPIYISVDKQDILLFDIDDKIIPPHSTQHEQWLNIIGGVTYA
ncbi:MAG TPA: ABC transporter ATP-binding protein [Christensenellaceae bacterium]|jgi:sn-glycerol 3-phosphate transport system ATP-binding protein|nr:ABC transporter ATP-binding protein [Christensenellaceae bacterium]